MGLVARLGPAQGLGPGRRVRRPGFGGRIPTLHPSPYKVRGGRPDLRPGGHPPADVHRPGHPGPGPGHGLHARHLASSAHGLFSGDRAPAAQRAFRPSAKHARWLFGRQPAGRTHGSGHQRPQQYPHGHRHRPGGRGGWGLHGPGRHRLHALHQPPAGPIGHTAHAGHRHPHPPAEPPLPRPFQPGAGGLLGHDRAGARGNQRGAPDKDLRPGRARGAPPGGERPGLPPAKPEPGPGHGPVLPPDGFFHQPEPGRGGGGGRPPGRVRPDHPRRFRGLHRLPGHAHLAHDGPGLGGEPFAAGPRLPGAGERGALGRTRGAGPAPSRAPAQRAQSWGWRSRT